MKQGQIELKVRRHFDAANCLKGYQGACANLHGHRWEVLASFRAQPATEVDSVGIMVDFKTLKRAVDACLPDHLFLNDLDEFKTEKFKNMNPTAEVLVWLIALRIERSVIDHGILGVDLASVELFESPDCSVVITR